MQLFDPYKNMYETLEKRHFIEFINDGTQNAYKIAFGVNFDIIRDFNNSEGLHPFDLNFFPIKAT